MLLKCLFVLFIISCVLLFSVRQGINLPCMHGEYENREKQISKERSIVTANINQIIVTVKWITLHRIFSSCQTIYDLGIPSVVSLCDESIRFSFKTIIISFFTISNFKDVSTAVESSLTEDLNSQCQLLKFNCRRRLYMGHCLIIFSVLIVFDGKIKIIIHFYIRNIHLRRDNTPSYWLTSFWNMNKNIDNSITWIFFLNLIV